MNDKEKFCRSFEWKIDIKWFDSSGYTPIDKSRRARIQLADARVVGHFSLFDVSIIDKNDGVIDRKRFAFDDYLDRNGRTDGRNDYPLGGNVCFVAIGHIGMGWYIAVPGSTRPLCEEIEKYIEIFK